MPLLRRSRSDRRSVGKAVLRRVAAGEKKRICRGEFILRKKDTNTRAFRSTVRTAANFILHPTQLYESITMFIVFGLLVYLHKKKKFDGQVLIAYGIIYSIFRFIVEFVRDDPRGNLLGINDLLGISTSQIISLD